jgi:hypothetical protein
MDMAHSRVNSVIPNEMNIYTADQRGGRAMAVLTVTMIPIGWLV